jgi:hypothetical protein
MSKNPYQLLGASIPPMLGRERLTQQIERHLLKPTPDHIQIVGPMLYGKSVVLNHLASKYRPGSGQFLTASYDDLRRGTPDTDKEFKRRFSSKIQQALTDVQSSLAAYIEPDSENIYEVLDFTFSELEEKGQRLLVFLDGFDHVLNGTELTAHLWHQLRNLAQRKSLRLITGSRRPLRELCRTEESRSSDFWEIFDPTPVKVGGLEESDWDGFLAPLEKTERPLDSSARKELINWSGGSPILTGALCHILFDENPTGTLLTKTEVDRAAEQLLDTKHQIIAQLWEDCPTPTRADLALLAEKKEFALSDLSDDRRRILEERGYAHAVGKRMRSSCRIMEQYASQQGSAVTDLSRLFGTADKYAANVRALLELRFTQVISPGLDREIRSLIDAAIHDLDLSPERTVGMIRMIANRALYLIWKAELPQNQKLPEEWIQNLRFTKLPFDLNNGLPRQNGYQCALLRAITGSEDVKPMARYITKKTSILLDHILSVGNFGQHRQDYPTSSVDKEFAALVLLTAIELVTSLTAELSSTAIWGK